MMEDENLIPINFSGSPSTMSTTPYPLENHFNETYYDGTWEKEMEKVISIVVPIFFSIVALVGLFGNLLVVMVVTFNKQMRNTTNLLILNLAVADILFIVFCVPFTATGYALPHDWPFGDCWCKIVQFLIYGTAFISIYTLVLMSLDRFLAVVYPIESMTWRTERNCRIAISLVWFFTVLFCLPVFTAHGEVVTSITNDSYCIFLNNQTVSFLPESWDIRWSLLIFQVSFLGSAYLFPLLLIIGLYSVMLYRLWTKEPVGRVSAESIKNKKRVIKMVMIVVLIFTLSWLPIHIILLLRSLKLYESTPRNMTFQIIAHILAYSNSCVNPILYAFLSEPFRRGFWAVITCIRPSGPHGVHRNGYEMADIKHVREEKGNKCVGHLEKPRAEEMNINKAV